MHRLNWAWWKRQAITHRKRFVRRRILEVGSGCARKDEQRYLGKIFRDKASKYVGIDLHPGTNVDLVQDFHEVELEPESFDVVLSASMLEHDSAPELSIDKMVACLVDGGFLYLVWGAANNKPHCLDIMDHYTRPAEYFFILLETAGIGIELFQYEKNILPVYKQNRWVKLKGTTADNGTVVLIGRKNREPKFSVIDEFEEEDLCDKEHKHTPKLTQEELRRKHIERCRVKEEKRNGPKHAALSRREQAPCEEALAPL